MYSLSSIFCSILANLHSEKLKKGSATEIIKGQKLFWL